MSQGGWKCFLCLSDISTKQRRLHLIPSGEEEIVAHWACFKCAECDKGLQSHVTSKTIDTQHAVVYSSQNKVLCTPHSVICALCGKNFSGENQKRVDLYERAYHASCASCCLCTLPLTDEQLLYSVKDNTMVCRKHVEEVCVGCKLPVKGDNSLSLSGKYVCHPSCFQCKRCNKDLQKEPFVVTKWPNEEDIKDLCLTCLFHADQCVSCGLDFSEEPVQAHENLWHEKCCTCAQCGSDLRQVDSICTNQSNQYICATHTDLTCALGCGRPILPGEEALAHEGAGFHARCFVCFSCDSPLDAKSNYEWKTKPDGGLAVVCSVHCAHCQMGIHGDCVDVDENSFHYDCFLCNDCGKVIEGAFDCVGDNTFLCPDCCD